jgi:Predicted transcriptional regulators|uniref:ArsR/SmtB family transcription factor n=1 Tax=Brucella pseudintermedia TaxID=370111 RepID=UPI000DE3EBF2|nr:metalloregulator ArsR/SmtB family transcription factor [Brucella pseudintermedia]
MKIDLESMQTAADDACELLKALANRHRLLILCQLIEGEKSVGQLAEFLGIRDSTVSQHLALLRRDRLIAGRRDGQTIWYRIESEPARSVLSVLCKSFCEPRAAKGTATLADGPSAGNRASGRRKVTQD